MDKRITLAVAGAGKTYAICHNLNPDSKNLILAYTHQNIANLQRELICAYGCVPQRTTIMTFDSFVYKSFLCPYEPLILEFFNVGKFWRNGLTFQSPTSKNIQIKKKWYANPNYKPDSTFEHYIYRNYYYCCYMTKLIVKANTRKNNLIRRAINAINKFFDNIFVDEFQDFREYDYELLIQIIKHSNNIYLVGDFYQHSVSGTNNSGKPFKVKNRDISYEEFIEQIERLHLQVDTASLKNSRRCPKSICELVNTKLKISIDSCNNNVGIVSFINDIAKLKSILDNPMIVKLVYSNSDKYKFKCINWGYSKGDTYSTVCVILTETFFDLDMPTFDISKISDITRNKIYVALTRTEGDLYITKKDLFDKIKKDYHTLQ